MPVDATRRIRVARLRGGSEPLIRRGALVLEDALRTASLPDAERGRLLLIRSLSLGVLRPEKGSAAVARLLEQHIAELARRAVHGADPRAADAQAVYFLDRLDAVVTLIQRLARIGSGSGMAWYWRQAVPGWQPELTAQQAGRLLLGALLTHDTGSESLAQAFQRLIESHGLDVVLHGVNEQDGSVLLQRCGWHDHGRTTDSRPAQPAATRVIPFPREWQPVLTRWVARWGKSDFRSLWLVAWAVQSWRSEHARPVEVLGEAKALVESFGGVSNLAASLSSAVEQPRLRAAGETGQAGRVDEPMIPDDAVQGERRPVYTAHAGFWFLIPLLIRAGFGRAMQDHPEWLDVQVPSRLLRSFADRLSIPPDDPVQSWLSDEGDGEPGQAAHESGVPAWNEGEPIVAGWRRSIRRWCRLQARLGMANLVRRPGWVCWTGTHVEVRMPLSDVDLRIRRAGLDLDPGWVPWLGRVIQFHYDAERRPHGTGGIAGH